MSELRLRTKVLLGVTAVVVAASAIILGINGYRYWDDQRSEDSRAAAVDAASRTVAAMFTYDHATVETELPKAADNLAEPFRKDYLTLIEKAIVPGAKDQQLTVAATTQASGVISADRAHAVVMLYLNQLATSKDRPDGTTSGSRVRVELDKSDDRWLVASVTPI
ncbi:h domain protein [Nocardia cyriacigeorgica]|uniref:h domain protein n=1 Tax=Nocardia cyriacigeorgica TaxID=135487 RepID=UPI002457F07D|nr:h domain protein [Nocardia cyriacigeorgica]